MSALITATNFEQTDDLYAALLAAQSGLSVAQKHAFNARLVLILANHIGDLGVLEDALVVASGDIESDPANG